MDGDEERPVRLRVFRDEAQDMVPLDLVPLFAAARGRTDNRDMDVRDAADAHGANVEAKDD